MTRFPVSRQPLPERFTNSSRTSCEVQLTCARSFII
jgi:hypothetical protein